jgi:hypothetical protein
MDSMTSNKKRLLEDIQQPFLNIHANIHAGYARAQIGMKIGFNCQLSTDFYANNHTKLRHKTE